jgi:plastocyanin
MKLGIVFALTAFVVTACSTTSTEPAPVEEPTEELIATEVPLTEPLPTEPQSTDVPPTDAPAPVISGDTDVTVIDSSYRLKVINIAVGTTVTWIYNGGLPHTVTADGGSFNSGTMGEGDTFTFTFEEVGTFPYFCRFHGAPGGTGMSGIVNVTEG